MGRKDTLSVEQLKFLEFIAGNPYICKEYYFTGGTPLTYFYLQHRLSEDIDLFTEVEEVNLKEIQKLLHKAQKQLSIIKIDYRQFFGLHTFNLHFSNKILKVDFNYYPFPRIEKGIKFGGLTVDSIYDIAVNKIHTIFMKPRARDFIDIYFILSEKKYCMKDLISSAKAKFDWHIDPVQLGTRFFSVADVHDYPAMLKKIDDAVWKEFFINEAKKLKGDIFY